MRITSFSGALALVLGLSLVACGGDDDGGGDYDTQRDAVEAISGAFCDFGARCDQLPEGTSESQCVSQLVSLICEDEEATCDEALPADSEDEIAQLEACINALDDVECPAEGEEPVLPAACDDELPTLRAALSKS
jgi:hypothetical protein